MTEGSQMMQPEFYKDSGAGPPIHFPETQSMDPRNSLEDYNRTMLHYTQRQMSTFVDLDGPGNSRGNGTSSRSSQSSGNSDNSSNGVLASQANGPPPTSAGSSADMMKSNAMDQATSGY
ncbi:hypothetical protein N7507_001914 [Penicillium longicatenatum]|nr:hypothetical protein N7507_001914 [Penicillium longicatenatum]